MFKSITVFYTHWLLRAWSMGFEMGQKLVHLLYEFQIPWSMFPKATVPNIPFTINRFDGQWILVFLHCGTYTILLPQFFSNFQSNWRLAKEFYLRLIWQKKIAWQWIPRFSTLCYTIWKSLNSTTTIFLLKFRESNFLLKMFTLHWFDGKKIAWQLISSFSTLWCGYYGDSLSHFLAKVSWK